MMKNVCITLVFIGCLFAFKSCRQEKRTELIYVQHHFSVPVSCVAPSRFGNEIYYIGLINGEIVRMNYRNNERTVINAGHGRIYDIVEKSEDTLWVGVRDEGLRLVAKGGVIRTYSLEANITYAPYDIERTKGGDIYVATSYGVHCLTQGEPGSTLHELYCPADSGKHFGVNRVVVTDSMIYCATADFGLVALNAGGGTKSVVCSEEVRCLFNHRDTLYAASDRQLYRINLGTNPMIDSCDKKDLFAHYTDTQGGLWELTSTEVKYTNRDGSLSHKLTGRMNSDYKNYSFCTEDFIVIAMDREVYFFSVHQNLIGDSNNVIAATTDKTDKSKCYFITNDNVLYCREKKTDEKKNEKIVVVKKGKLKNFDNTDKIIELCSSKKYLWFITKNNLYKIDPAACKVTPVMEGNNKDKTDFKSLFFVKDKKQLLIGSRYNLYRIKNPDDEKIKVETVKLSTKDTLKNTNLYITDIGSYGDIVYCTALNNGLLKLDKDSLRMYALDTLTIHGISKFENIGLLVHASDAIHIFDIKKGTITDRNNKFIKELSSIYYYNDNNYLLIGHTGISYCHIGTDTIGDAKFELLDMSFNSAAIAEGEDGKLILGSATGLYIYDHGNHKMEHVVIPQDKLLRNTLYFFTQNMTMPTWLLISGFIAMIFAGYYFRIFKPQKAKNKGNFQSGNKELASSSQQRIEGSAVPKNPENNLPQSDNTAQVTSDEPAPTPTQQKPEGNTNPANGLLQPDNTTQVTSDEPAPTPTQQKPEGNTNPENTANDLSQPAPQPANFPPPVKSPMDIAADEIKQTMNELAEIPEAKDEKKDEVDEKIKELVNKCNLFIKNFKKELAGLHMAQNQMRPMATVWIYAYTEETDSAKLGDIFKKYKKHRLPNSAYEISKLWDRIFENISKIPAKERTSYMNTIYEHIKLLQSENKKSR